MTKRILLGGIAMIALIAAIVGYMFFKAPEEASQPLQAIPLATKPATTSTPTAAAQPSIAAATVEPTAAEAVASPMAEPTTGNSANPMVFEIAQAESQAIFMIDEVLEGAPKTVVGTTDQVAGQISIDPANPTATQIGIIQVNARTFATDSSMRDRAIKNRILMTDANELITFAPTEVTGLPTSGEVGQTYTFNVTGDLTIKGITKPTSFEVSVTVPSADRLEGSAKTTIRYADFDVAIPSVPMVARVSDEVALELKFVALAVQ